MLCQHSLKVCGFSQAWIPSLLEKQQKIAKILKQTGFTWPISSLKLQLVSYPGALAGFILVVNLVLCSFVQFGPQGFDLPGADCSLQGAVEVAVVQRIQLQLPAEDAEGLQSPFTGGRLDKVLKEHAGLRHALVLRLTHLFWWETVSTVYLLPVLLPFPAHFHTVSTGLLRSGACHHA